MGWGIIIVGDVEVLLVMGALHVFVVALYSFGASQDVFISGDAVALLVVGISHGFVVAQLLSGVVHSSLDWGVALAGNALPIVATIVCC